MKVKPVTPYEHLKREMISYCDSVEHRHTVPMQFYPNASKSGTTYTLTDLSHKVDAANQLGYDVMLSNKTDGLHVHYVKKIPTRPFLLTY